MPKSGQQRPCLAMRSGKQFVQLCSVSRLTAELLPPSISVVAYVLTFSRRNFQLRIVKDACSEVIREDHELLNAHFTLSCFVNCLTGACGRQTGTACAI